MDIIINANDLDIIDYSIKGSILTFRTKIEDEIKEFVFIHELRGYEMNKLDLKKYILNKKKNLVIALRILFTPVDIQKSPKLVII
jgi:hypothetical protein